MYVFTNKIWVNQKNIERNSKVLKQKYQQNNSECCGK